MLIIGAKKPSQKKTSSLIGFEIAPLEDVIVNQSGENTINQQKIEDDSAEIKSKIESIDAEQKPDRSGKPVVDRIVDFYSQLSRIDPITEEIKVKARVILSAIELENVLSNVSINNLLLGRPDQKYFLGTGCVIAIVNDNRPGYYDLENALWFVVPREHIEAVENDVLRKFLQIYNNRKTKSWWQRWFSR